MTNEHVVDDNPTARIYPAIGGGPFSADVVGKDELRDLAVIRYCCDQRFRALELASPNEVEQGVEVVAFGYPYRGNVAYGLSVSDGIISAVEYYELRESYMVQTDAAVNPGNSGGPLINKFGKVVGTVASKFESTPGGRPIDNIGFAVASRTIMEHLPALEANANRTPTPTPTLGPTNTPTPTRPPTFTPTPVPSNWIPVLVAVGNRDQRMFDSEKRRIVSQSLKIPVGSVPNVESGYKLTRSDVSSDEIVVQDSGTYSLRFEEITGTFDGFKSLLHDGAIKFFGRVCDDSLGCAPARFQDLKNYVGLDEDIGSGTVDIAPWVTVACSVPAGQYLRIEAVGYFTSSE